MAVVAAMTIKAIESKRPTALIIGGSGGIGRAIARTFTQMGFALALVARDLEKLERARAEFGDGAKDALLISCNVTERAQVQRMVEKVLDGMSSIDTLIYAAGLNVRQRSLRSLDPADWDQIISANLTGAFNVLHFVLPSMRARGSGLIVQISSLSGMRANVVSGAAYSAAKFAQSALGICIGREERGRGIRSTVIYAGEVNTDFLGARAARPGGGDDGRCEKILQPDDIAAAVRFLVQLPVTAHVPELVIKPVIDDFS
jgi:NADP-dependent 3-hydroxy acid dehydrogenase YdfG